MWNHVVINYSFCDNATVTEMRWLNIFPFWVGQDWVGMYKRTPARCRMDLKSISSESMGVTLCGKLWLKVSSVSQLRQHQRSPYRRPSISQVCAICLCWVFLVFSLGGVVGSFSTVCWWPAAGYQSTLFKSRCLRSTRVWSFCLLCGKRGSMGSSRVWYLWVTFFIFSRLFLDQHAFFFRRNILHFTHPTFHHAVYSYLRSLKSCLNTLSCCFLTGPAWTA